MMKRRFTMLIVDDLKKKQEMVVVALSNRLKHFDVAIDTADRYEGARDKLQAKSYDFVILDIKIPAGSEAASERWSRQLLRDILEGNLCFPMHVFGLTEHEEIVDAEREFYKSNMFGFYLFDWENDEWAKHIARKIEYLALAIQNGASYQLNSYDYDLLLIVARFKNEFLPVKQRLFGKQKGMGHPLWPDMAHFGYLSFKQDQKLRAALICIVRQDWRPRHG